MAGRLEKLDLSLQVNKWVLLILITRGTPGWRRSWRPYPRGWSCIVGYHSTSVALGVNLSRARITSCFLMWQIHFSILHANLLIGTTNRVFEARVYLSTDDVLCNILERVVNYQFLRSVGLLCKTSRGYLHSNGGNRVVPKDWWSYDAVSTYV